MWYRPFREYVKNKWPCKEFTLMFCIPLFGDDVKYTMDIFRVLPWVYKSQK
ncbi:hypothetical protein BgiBS90_021687, partial [Biomphalaria glabrata]